MFSITVQLAKEIHNAFIYHVQINEQGNIREYDVTKINETFNYVEEDIKEIPEQIIDFVEDYLLEKF